MVPGICLVITAAVATRICIHHEDHVRASQNSFASWQCFFPAVLALHVIVRVIVPARSCRDFRVRPCVVRRGRCHVTVVLSGSFSLVLWRWAFRGSAQVCLGVAVPAFHYLSIWAERVTRASLSEAAGALAFPRALALRHAFEDVLRCSVALFCEEGLEFRFSTFAIPVAVLALPFPYFVFRWRRTNRLTRLTGFCMYLRHEALA